MTQSPITAVQFRISTMTYAELVQLLETFNASPEARSPEYAVASVGIAIKMQMRKVLRPVAEGLSTPALTAEIRRIYEAEGWVLEMRSPERVAVDVYCETLEERHGLSDLLDNLVDEADTDAPAAESNQLFIETLLRAAERA